MLTSSRVQGSTRHSFWSEVYETVLSFWLFLPTTLALFQPRGHGFNVTAKRGRIDETFFDRNMVLPHVVLAVCYVLTLCAALFRLWMGIGEQDVLLINLCWLTYNGLILAAAIAVAWEEKQVRKNPRLAVRLPGMLRLNNGCTARCRVLDLAQGGASISLFAEGAGYERGDQLSLSILGVGDEVPLPAAVVEQHGNTVRLQFLPLSIEQESCLVQAMFSRADSWVGWAQGRAEDRLFGSFREVAAVGLGGVQKMMRARARRKAVSAPPPPVAQVSP
jgi:cellulose synthase (UDP-forming)